jgi:uncharacterized PurR-regulated membrane protein YhhQ (DUF165 family)
MKKLIYETKVLLRNVPSLVFSLFVVSIVAMNILANKSIVNLPYLCLDAGIIVSWMSFLSMDMITKRFGPKSAFRLSVVASLINLIVCLLFFAGSKIPGLWGESYIEGSEDIINRALDNTIGGSWFVLLGSTIAFLLSSFVNDFLNWSIGKMFRKNPDGFLAFASRTYISTAIGQFVDNLTFALIVSHFFFGWNIVQCLTCSATGAVAELICEIVFSPIGFKICQKWDKEKVGKEYLDLVGGAK